MSDDGERTCPLCAEEMDITDQQLKPCKCGYEICVWCWHQIIDMAEKEDSEGRCPACRTPYDKDRIVGMAANCERVVAEVNAEKRQKPQKGKPKTPAEARKHLSSVRVVQRNLVYIIGLPSNLSDEALLERKEYFGQYGKVLKVSIGRPTSAVQQASNNSTFSVYITYAREEEAIRCIQAVHNFVLDGKQLRACFGTTKYCHSWLRNMTCSNPDCLYLHDIGSQEDSFTKDEIISAYTRSRVPQIATNNLQRRSGTILPPPTDELLNGGTYSSRNTTKSAPSNSMNQVKVPFPNNSFLGKPTVLPAAASWGTRRQAVASVAGTQGSAKQKSEANNGLVLNPPVVVSTRSTSAWHDEVVASSKMYEGTSAASSSSRSKPSENLNPHIGSNSAGLADGSSEALNVPGVSITSAWDDEDDDCVVGTIMKGPEEKHEKLYTGCSAFLEHLEPRITADCGQSRSNLAPEIDLDGAHAPGNTRSPKTQSPSSNDGDTGIIFPRSQTTGAAEDLGRQYSCSIDSSKSIKEYTVDDGNGDDDVVWELSSLVIDDYIAVDQSRRNHHATSVPSQESVCIPASASVGLRQCAQENEIGLFGSVGSEGPSLMSDANISQDKYDTNPRSGGLAACAMKQSDDVALVCDGQIHGFSGAANQVSSSHLQLTNNVANNGSCSSRNDVVIIENGLVASEKESILMNGHVQVKPYTLKNEKVPDISSAQENVKSDISDHQDAIKGTPFGDMGESSIISNILALDFDPWTDSLSTANNFSSMLSEADNNGLCRFSNLRKSHKNNESRFLFARQENQEFNVETSFGSTGQSERSFPSSRYACGEGIQNNYLGDKFAGTAFHDSSISAVQSDTTTGGLRAKISAPPGFSVHTKAPPGFSSQDKHNQVNETAYSEKQLHSSSVANQYQTQMHLTENMGDVEFYDPAILAVGKHRLPFGGNNSGLSLGSAYSAQTIPFESDPRLHLLMQQPISAEQDLRVADHFGNRFLPSSESHISSRILAHNDCDLSRFAQISVRQPSNSHVIQNHWDGWNDTQTGNVDIDNVLRNMRYGLHDYQPGNEEHKFHLSSSSDMYNRSFRM